MQSNSIRIREATPEDAPALLAIYAPYVEQTAISFEYAVPTPEEFRRRMWDIQAAYPYLVAEQEGQPVGYAYASAFHPRYAYRFAAEVTIYVAQDMQLLGLGKALYSALEQCLIAMHVENLNACIGYPVGDDPYLTANSADFHRHMGYRLVGRFEKCGYKFGRWYDMIWMEKQLGTHPDQPLPLLPFPAVREGLLPMNL